MKDIDEFLEKYTVILSSDGIISDVEAHRRATMFLEACAHLISYKHQLLDEEIKSSSLSDINFAEALNKQEGGDAKKREVNAKADLVYIQAKETFEQNRNRTRTIDKFYDVFMNAHIFYRKLSSDLESRNV